MCSERMKSVSVENWHSGLHDRTLLRSDRLYKNEFDTEWCLDYVNAPKYRISTQKNRASSHDLQISKHPTIQNLDNHEQFICLMFCNGRHILTWLGKLLHKSFDIRNMKYIRRVFRPNNTLFDMLLLVWWFSVGSYNYAQACCSVSPWATNWLLFFSFFSKLCFLCSGFQYQCIFMYETGLMQRIVRQHCGSWWR